MFLSLPLVSSAELQEKEPNNSLTTSTPIDLGKWYNGFFHEDNEDDFYKFDIPSDGKVEVLFNNDGKSTDGSVNFIIKNGAGDTFDSTKGRSDLVGDEVAYVSLPKGTYYVHVYNDYWYSDPYKIKVNFTAGDYYEKEFNNNFFTATAMELGKEYIGSVPNYEDDDFYKVVLKEAGKLNICLNNSSSNNNDSYPTSTVYVKDGKNNIYSENEVKGNQVEDDCAVVGLPSGDFYIQVEADYWYEGNYDYTVDTAFTPTAYYEKELNGSIHTANEVSLNKTYSGQFNGGSDTDYYKVRLASKGKLILDIVNKSTESYADMYVSLLDSNGNEYNDFWTNDRSFVTTQELPAGNYFLKLESDGYYNYDYHFTIYNEIKRYAGADRYKTAVEISKEGWTSAGTVVLATGTNFPDALAGGPLAYQEDAPILLTQGNSLNAATKTEIERLGASKVIILGKEGAVSAGVSNELKKMGLSIDRIGGSDRFDTAAQIAKRLKSDKAVLANGRNFPDALSIAPYASRNGIPILLTDKDDLPSVTKQALTGKKSTIIAGGTGVVSDKVKSQLPEPTRYGGKDRYDTGRNIISNLAMGQTTGIVATGLNYPDALAGSVLAAKKNAPILLVPGDSIPSSIQGLLKNYDTFSIIGSSGAVSYEIEDTLLRK